MRRRITAIAVLISTMVLAVVGVAVVVVVRAELFENLDRSLDQRAAEVAATIDGGSTDLLVTSSPEDHFAQVLAADGSLVAATSNARVVAPSVAARAGSSDRFVFTTSDLPIEDDAYRVLVISDSTGAIVVGENVDDLRDTLRALVMTLAVVFPVAVLLLGAAVWWLVGRTLRPVESIRREVDAIGLRELGHRVPVPGTGDEVDRLAVTTNEMLERLDRSVTQQRRFVADASHELRTPLTRMRTTIEVERATGAMGADAALQTLLDDAVEMQQLVDDLLYLARRDAVGEDRASSPDVTAPVDLADLVDDEVAAFAVTSPDVTFDVSADAAGSVAGNEEQLRRLVRNLLSNAARHASGCVEIAVTDRSHPERAVVLTVADDGPGIPAEERERVFERFVRLDDARSPEVGRTGLGLAIVREIARGHGGRVLVAERDGGGARLEVMLPAMTE